MTWHERRSEERKKKLVNTLPHAEPNCDMSMQLFRFRMIPNGWWYVLLAAFVLFVAKSVLYAIRLQLPMKLSNWNSIAAMRTNASTHLFKNFGEFLCIAFKFVLFLVLVVVCEFVCTFYWLHINFFFISLAISMEAQLQFSSRFFFSKKFHNDLVPKTIYVNAIIPDWS